MYIMPAKPAVKKYYIAILFNAFCYNLIHEGFLGLSYIVLCSIWLFLCKQ